MGDMTATSTEAVCACELYTNGVRVRPAHAEYGPEKSGWSLICTSGYNEEYYINVSHCPFCGTSLTVRESDTRPPYGR